jgi:hypothetical protein
VRHRDFLGYEIAARQRRPAAGFPLSPPCCPSHCCAPWARKRESILTAIVLLLACSALAQMEMPTRFLCRGCGGAGRVAGSCEHHAGAEDLRLAGGLDHFGLPADTFELWLAAAHRRRNQRRLRHLPQNFASYLRTATMQNGTNIMNGSGRISGGTPSLLVHGLGVLGWLRQGSLHWLP